MVGQLLNAGGFICALTLCALTLCALTLCGLTLCFLTLGVLVIAGLHALGLIVRAQSKFVRSVAVVVTDSLYQCITFLAGRVFQYGTEPPREWESHTGGPVLFRSRYHDHRQLI